mgnify:CR=1 FL=1
MIGHEHKDKYHPNHPSVDQSDRPVLRLDGQRGYRSRGLEVLFLAPLRRERLSRGDDERRSSVELNFGTPQKPRQCREAGEFRRQIAVGTLPLG